MDARPTSIELEQLSCLYSAGDFLGLEVAARDLLENYPKFGFVWQVLGVALNEQGKDGLAALRQAVRFLPTDSQAHSNLGNAFKAAGRLQEAEASYRSALSLDSSNVIAAYNLGAVLQEQGDALGAEAAYLKALALQPDFVLARYNLGTLQDKVGNFVGAEASYHKVLNLQPDHVQALYNLGCLSMHAGRLSEAEGFFRRVLALQPSFVDAQRNLGLVLRLQWKVEEATEAYWAALRADSNNLDLVFDLGFLYQQRGLYAEAVVCYRRVLAGRPAHLKALHNLALVLGFQGNSVEAEAMFREALAVDPSEPNVYVGLGGVYLNRGSFSEAEALFRQALALEPNCIAALSHLLVKHTHDGGHSEQQRLEDALRFGRLVSEMVQGREYRNWQCEKEPLRLRVGLVSADIRDHSVGHFLESFIKCIDPSRVELIAYPTNSATSDLTNRVKPYFSMWHSLVGLDDEAAARLIYDDGAHVLLDLTGHFYGNRLPVFAWRPAPVQASWLGYCATTGVAQMDYYIADAQTLPTEQERNFVEKIWRLPDSYLCFSQPVDDVAVPTLPALANGYVTFGSFNNLSKMTDQTVEAWAKLLHAVPGSRLALKSGLVKESAVRDTIRARFAAFGIAAERLLLLDRTAGRREHLEAYGQVDIGLDPFPYNGVTTTMEALWMGVPVLSLAGENFLARQGVGILTHASLQDWIATDVDDLVAKAVRFATNLGKLAELRMGMRERILASPLLDAKHFARNFEDALWGMWRQFSRV